MHTSSSVATLTHIGKTAMIVCNRLALWLRGLFENSLPERPTAPDQMSRRRDFEFHLLNRPGPRSPCGNVHSIHLGLDNCRAGIICAIDLMANKDHKIKTFAARGRSPANIKLCSDAPTCGTIQQKAASLHRHTQNVDRRFPLGSMSWAVTSDTQPAVIHSNI